MRRSTFESEPGSARAQPHWPAARKGTTMELGRLVELADKSFDGGKAFFGVRGVGNMRRTLDECPFAAGNKVDAFFDGIGRSFVVGSGKRHAGNLDVLHAFADVPVFHLAGDYEFTRALHDHVTLADAGEGVGHERGIVLGL